MERTILRWVGWTVFALVAFVVACNVVNRFGHTTGFLVALTCAGAAWAATDKSRALVNLFRDALAESGISEGAFAIDYGTSKAQLSNALNHREAFNFSRAAEGPEVVWQAFSRKVLEQSGQFVVLKVGAVTELIAAVQAQTAATPAPVHSQPHLAFSSERDVA